MKKTFFISLAIMLFFGAMSQGNKSSEKINVLIRCDDIGMCHSVNMAEIEAELKAQIQKAINSGLKIDYLDHHMGAAVQTPQTRAIVEKLAKEFHLGISRYFEEDGIDGWYFTAPKEKADSMLYKLKNLQSGNIKLFVVHVGLEGPEMNAMEDLNPFGPKEMSKHRMGELSGLISPDFQTELKDKKYRLINYRMVIAEKGLGEMRKPKE